jgi:hypothetical protein
MRTIPLTKGLFALVDDEDFQIINMYKWYAQGQKKSNTNYACRCELVSWKPKKKKYYYMHREILGIHDKKIHVDHKDHNGLNNQKTNIRSCDRFQNQRNRKRSNGGSSQYKGVYYRKDRHCWSAQIRINGIIHCLGHFSKEQDAAFAYDNMAKIHHGEFAHLNLPVVFASASGAP